MIKLYGKVRPQRFDKKWTRATNRWGCKVRAKFVATNGHFVNQCPTSLGMGLRWTDSNSERRKLEYLERWETQCWRFFQWCQCKILLVRKPNLNQLAGSPGWGLVQDPGKSLSHPRTHPRKNYKNSKMAPCKKSI